MTSWRPGRGDVVRVVDLALPQLNAYAALDPENFARQAHQLGSGATRWRNGYKPSMSTAWVFDQVETDPRTH